MIIESSIRLSENFTYSKIQPFPARLNSFIEILFCNFLYKPKLSWSLDQSKSSANHTGL